MLESKWIFELLLIIYALSLVGYFIDFMKQNKKVNQLAFRLLCAVWLIQTALLLHQFFVLKTIPFLTLNDGLFFYAWILITFSLILNQKFAVHFTIFFINVFNFIILLLSILLNAQRLINQQSSQFIHEILLSHIVITIISYACLTLSFVFSLMYLIQYYLLKNKKAISFIWRFGNLKWLDHYSFMTVIIGVPLLIIGISCGIVWAYVSTTEFYWIDFKTLGSIIVVVVYMLYLFLRVVKKYKGKIVSVYNIGAFLLLLLNYFLFSLLSNFHFN
ncbi:inner membrane protein YpjD [Ornithinibacillus sp. 4-3]|uniref:Inner membrane protein YpjD n=1 Tax=Ornithinibacillus sp. 4-3 TaxID=3231488 RepID=A0AB39HLU2_9BACI